MKKMILVAVMGLLGFGASAQGIGKVNMGNSSASTQASVTGGGLVTVNAKQNSIMMNSTSQVSNVYENGEIAMVGDEILIKATNNFGAFEYKGFVTLASTTQLYVVGDNLITGQTYSITLENANTGNPDDAIRIDIPSTGEVYILSYL